VFVPRQVVGIEFCVHLVHFFVDVVDAGHLFLLFAACAASFISAMAMVAV
jgi:hypothetical protein